MDLPQLLPDDLLAIILRCLQPRSLAVSRSVCKNWCVLIDTRRLLRADLLPLSLYGIFFTEDLSPDMPKFFTRPSTERKIAAWFDYMDINRYMIDSDDTLNIEDHCNGLLLLREWLVVNPATRRWLRLPPAPPPGIGYENFYDDDRCLVFDPMVSPHYEVFVMPLLPMDVTNSTAGSEWPPSPYTMPAFSSRTLRWEERSFVREGEAAGTVADMRPFHHQKCRYTIYWRGALYAHCPNDSVMRITLSNHRYRVIKSPTGSKVVTADDSYLYLGKSKKGVYCALFYHGDRWEEERLKVWLLNESCDQMEWVLKSDIDLQLVVAKVYSDFPKQKFPWIYGPWILQEVNYDEDSKEPLVEEKFEWDFDNGAILVTEDKVEDQHYCRSYFLGFHPHKEIAFFWVNIRVIAYHLNSSKVQDLGFLGVESVRRFFPYTPCWTGELSENN